MALGGEDFPGVPDGVSGQGVGDFDFVGGLTRSVFGGGHLPAQTRGVGGSHHSHLHFAGQAGYGNIFCLHRGGQAKDTGYKEFSIIHGFYL